MSKSKSSISKAQSYEAIGEFWDKHDLTKFWKQTKSAKFKVNIQSEVIYFPLEGTLSAQVAEAARQRGVSPETLVNLWVQEKLLEKKPII